MTIDPVLLFVGFMTLVVLWQLVRVVRIWATGRRVPPSAVLLVVAFFVGMLGTSLLTSSLAFLSSDVVGWHLSTGIGGPKFDPSAAEPTTMVAVEVSWPGCVDQRDYSWLKPDIAYTPWSVTITLRTTDAYARNPKCHPRRRSPGGLPIVGSYLSDLAVPVYLREPLAGRALFDGSQFPSAARPYTRPKPLAP